MFVKFLVKFDLKFEISDVKKRWNLGGGLFYLPGARVISERIPGHISEQISGKTSETSFRFCALCERASLQAIFQNLPGTSPSFPVVARPSMQRCCWPLPLLFMCTFPLPLP